MNLEYVSGQKKKNPTKQNKNMILFIVAVRFCIEKNNGQLCNVIQQSDRVYNVTFLREYIS